ncbi:pfs domain-containing protein [Ophiostoma piceae UAMH 11346]|uniref:Pfs domain-containing protein n=1 Tax=Ophiostoma piceae (strain UAMH 11346) TaxID=1262450 RepID=S3BNF1_OPHP1|nr:pfs domain-containing protein [Ophiostoma piceae UAMH 11346]
MQHFAALSGVKRSAARLLVMASTSIPISSIPEWQLLQAVSPVFSSPELKWKPHCPDPSHKAVTDDSVKLLRHHLSEIPLYFDPEEELAHTHHGLFALTAGSLLSIMEETVDHRIPQAFGDDDNPDQNRLYSNALLREEWPKLLGLAYLQYKSQAWTSHLVLTQDSSVFKNLQAKAILFANLAKLILPSGIVQTAKPPGEPSSSCNHQRPDNAAQAREIFCGYSKRLFAGIVRRLAGCQSPHKALLHLKGPSDAHDGQPAPKLSMFVAFCPEKDTWQQVVCSEHVASAGSAWDDSSADVDDICELARSCSEIGCILGMELKGDTLLNTSDQSMDEQRSHLDDASTTKFTLGELLRRGIFQDSYKVFPNDKKILAYILARALLWLYDGPWLQTPWSADNLVFRYDATAQTIHDVHQPYILCDLLEDLPPPVSGKLHHALPVLAFAKILIELDQGCADETSDATYGALLQTVIKYYNEKKNQSLTPGYTKALHSSIFFNKHFRNIRGKNPNATIQDAILEGIVKPLELDVHMDKKDQWGCRNVTLENATFVMAPPAMPEKLSGRRPPGTQHPTTALPNKPKTGSSTAASRPSVHPTPTRARPASRRITPTKIPVLPIGTAGTRTVARRNAMPTKSMSGPRTIAPGETRGSRSNVLQTTNDGDSMSRNLPGARVNGLRSDCINSQKSPPREPELDLKRGSLCRVPTSDSQVSVDTFRCMNSVADEYLQHTEDDTPIRVAVIDTGIDREHADFKTARTKKFHDHKPNPARSEQPQKSRIREWKNFCKDQPEDDVSDLDGHGTQVAGIILRLAPNADLYVARVCTGDINYGVASDRRQQRRPGMVATPELEAVKNAITWAIAKKVDIINLSLGYTNFQRAEIDELSTLLHSTSSTIIFAAAANHGSHEKVAWPARDQRVAIAIHSSIDSGTRASDFCARALESNDNFMTVGEGILSQWPTAKDGGFRLCSGTSFSTPVATATGALILGFTQEKGQSLFRQQAAEKVDLRELHTVVGLQKVLRSISTMDSRGYRWIHSKLFWHDFEGDNDEAFRHAWDIIIKALRI